MSIQIDIEKPIEDLLRQEWGNLEQAAKEALLLESYRQAKIGLADVAQALGFESRIAAQEWLARHAVPLNYDLSDYEQDLRTLSTLHEMQIN